MKDIKNYIQDYASECEKRAQNWEERIRIYEERIIFCDDAEKMHELKFEREQCIGKKNELLVVADFCNGLLQHYFS